MDRRTELRQAWRELPQMHLAFQNMVLAMENAENARGKRTLFGRDKAQPAHEKFADTFKAAIHAMFSENMLSKNDGSSEIAIQFIDMLNMFAEAYPNWPEAYRFAAQFFDASNRTKVVALIGEVTSFQEFLDRPTINYGPKVVQNEDDKWWETDPRIKKVFDARKR